jgi:predicted DNA-binding transcriptional regulator YafY
LTISYVDTHGRTTQRRVHPLRLETLHGRQILVAHCELRGEERHFRLDRILAWHVED